ncbi:MAG: Gfo/Idh/MocA family oxidoreductase [Candidatus Uhrbacteria bacterium]|nr:Gfo/Idh/MocA family oxidoreductase [Candidatus Uhrbacteria bacterium]
MSENKITFAIIGCGAIAMRHAEHISRMGTLVSVCDVKEERADDFAKKFNTKAYYSLEELFAAKVQADVVAICSPNGLHAEHAIKALRTAHHVICEKPMALTVRDCERMIMEAEKAGKKLFIVKQNRFNPPIALTKQLLDENKLGKILSVQVSCFWNRNEDYYKKSDWRGTKHLDGGVLYTQFSHFIDLLYWMFGDIKEVGAYVGNSNHSYIEIDDHGVVIFKFLSDVLGTLHYSINSHRKNMEGSLVIFGEKGTLKIGGEYLNVLEHASVEGYEVPHLPKGNTANDYGTYKGSMSNHDKIYENVIEVLRGNGAISTSGMEGLKTVEIIARIYDQARW